MEESGYTGALLCILLPLLAPRLCNLQSRVRREPARPRSVVVMCGYMQIAVKYTRCNAVPLSDWAATVAGLKEGEQCRVSRPPSGFTSVPFPISRLAFPARNAPPWPNPVGYSIPWPPCVSFRENSYLIILVFVAIPHFRTGPEYSGPMRTRPREYIDVRSIFSPAE